MKSHLYPFQTEDVLYCVKINLKKNTKKYIDRAMFITPFQAAPYLSLCCRYSKMALKDRAAVILAP